MTRTLQDTNQAGITEKGTIHGDITQTRREVVSDDRSVSTKVSHTYTVSSFFEYEIKGWKEMWSQIFIW